MNIFEPIAPLALRTKKNQAALLCLDVAEFSTFDTPKQLEVITGIVSHLHVLFPSTCKSQLNWLNEFPTHVFSSTGDGFVVAFCRSRLEYPSIGNDILRTIACLIEIGRKLNVKIRFGMHVGNVLFYEELHDRIGMCGYTVNMAVRIMDIGGQEHILCSKKFFDEVLANASDLEQWVTKFASLRRVKHDQIVRIRNIFQLNPDTDSVLYGDNHNPPIEACKAFKFPSEDQNEEIQDDIVNAKIIKCQALSAHPLTEVLLTYAKKALDGDEKYKLKWEKLIFYLPLDKHLVHYDDSQSEIKMPSQRQSAEENFVELIKIGKGEHNRHSSSIIGKFEVCVQFINMLPNCALLGFDPESDGTTSEKEVGRIRFTLYLWGVHARKSPSLDACHPGPEYLPKTEYNILLDAFKNDRENVKAKLILEDGKPVIVDVPPGQGV